MFALSIDIRGTGDVMLTVYLSVQPIVMPSVLWDVCDTASLPLSAPLPWGWICSLFFGFARHFGPWAIFWQINERPTRLQIVVTLTLHGCRLARVLLRTAWRILIGSGSHVIWQSCDQSDCCELLWLEHWDWEWSGDSFCHCRKPQVAVALAGIQLFMLTVTSENPQPVQSKLTHCYLAPTAQWIFCHLVFLPG